MRTHGLQHLSSLVACMLRGGVRRALETFKPMPGGDAAERMLATCLVNVCLKYGHYNLSSGKCTHHNLGAEFFQRMLSFFADDNEALAYFHTLCTDKGWQQAYAAGLYSDRCI